MKSSAKKIELASVYDLFSTEEVRQDAKLEKIQEIPLSELENQEKGHIKILSHAKVRQGHLYYERSDQLR